MVALAITATCTAGGQPASSIFIPFSAATKEEVAEFREGMKSQQFTEEEIDEAIRLGFGSFLYREADVRATFANVRPTDRQLSVCTNSIMGGATRIVFISEPAAPVVTVKTASCSAHAGGLWCSPMAERRAYFLESPEEFFFVSGLTFEDARAVLLAYEQDVRPNLPDWFARHSLREVTNVAATAQGYRLTFGEFYCAGCESEITVRFEKRGRDEHLTLVGEPKGMCI
jgi:hypothetical protein